MIYIITWQTEESYGVVRAYADPERAKADLAMLKEQSERDFEIEEVVYLDE